MTARAIDPDRAPSQYIRDRWEGSRGFPGGPVFAITQTDDGYLWIAAEKGLVRFDGLSFQLVQPAEPASGTDRVALQLLPASGGAFWARLRRADVVRYRNGAYEHLPSDPGEPMMLTTAMTRANDGAMLAADQRRGVVVTRGVRFETLVAGSALPRSVAISIAQTRSGDIWLGTRDAGLVRVHRGQVVPVSEGLPDLKINCLVADGNDQLWIGTDAGVVRWDGHRVTRAGLPAALDRVRATAMIKDRDANAWIATTAGLLRVNSRGGVVLDQRVPGSGVTALFEDRDGNLWIGTTTGIERWRDGVFTTYPEARSVTTGNAGPIFVDAARRVWFAPPAGGLYWLRDGRMGRVTEAGLKDDVIYSLSGGSDLWVGRQRGGLSHLRARGDDFTVETFTKANGLAQDQVYSVHRGRDGAIWAGTLSGGVSRYKDGVFTTYTTADGLASNTVASVLDAADGTVWFATPDGASARSARGWRRFSTTDGLPSNDVNTVFEDSAHNVWLGTSTGLALIRDGRVPSELQLPNSLQSSILGIAEDSTGWLWMTTADRVLRVDRTGLLNGSLGESGVREYGAADGLLGIDGVKRDRSLTVDTHGRIWLSTNGGLAMVDPVRVAGHSAPALVHVDGVSADGASVSQGGPISIGPRHQRIILSFAGLSLAAPERVRFRYRLDGFDHDWSAPGSAHQAEYTNLGPGPYRFRVMASNGDGVWNPTEATLPFTIEPAFWQSPLFQALLVLLAVVAVWGAYRVRVTQVARQIAVRFEERLGERTRIARELHDTLLQSFQGALVRFHTATLLLPDRPDQARTTLEDAIDHAAQAISEGRDAVQGLRSSTVAANDLARSITTLGEDLVRDRDARRAPAFRVHVEGESRALAPVLGDEVYRIAAEALRNAFHHADASHIEVEIRYDRRLFRLRVRDDGKGINQAVLDGGQAGHFGLRGMHERARLVGGKLSVWSEVDSGTEVELTIPGSVAYAKSVVHPAAPAADTQVEVRST